MTNSTALRQPAKPLSASYVINAIGLIAGATVAAASLATLSPLSFFAGLAAALFCLDGTRH